MKIPFLEGFLKIVFVVLLMDARAELHCDVKHCREEVSVYIGLSWPRSLFGF